MNMPPKNDVPRVTDRVLMVIRSGADIEAFAAAVQGIQNNARGRGLAVFMRNTTEGFEIFERETTKM